MTAREMVEVYLANAKAQCESLVTGGVTGGSLAVPTIITGHDRLFQILAAPVGKGEVRALVDDWGKAVTAFAYGLGVDGISLITDGMDWFVIAFWERDGDSCHARQTYTLAEDGAIVWGEPEFTTEPPEGTVGHLIHRHVVREFGRHPNIREELLARDGEDGFEVALVRWAVTVMSKGFDQERFRLAFSSRYSELAKLFAAAAGEAAHVHVMSPDASADADQVVAEVQEIADLAHLYATSEAEDGAA